MRLVGVNDARIAAQLIRHVQARMARREQHVPKDALPVELETAVDCAHALDATLCARSAPSRSARAAPRRVRGSPRRSGGTGRARTRRAARANAAAARLAARGRATTSRGSGRRSRSASRAGGSPSAHRRHAAVGSSSVPKTVISSGKSPPRRRVWYAVNPASPEPTTATLTSRSPPAAPARSSAGTRRTQRAAQRAR